MKKHIAIILAVFAAIFFLGACGAKIPTPTETVDTFLQALKDQDGEAMVSVYAGGSMDLIDEAMDTEDGESEESAPLGYGGILQEILCGFEHGPHSLWRHHARLHVDGTLGTDLRTRADGACA